MLNNWCETSVVYLPIYRHEGKFTNLGVKYSSSPQWRWNKCDEFLQWMNGTEDFWTCNSNRSNAWVIQKCTFYLTLLILFMPVSVTIIPTLSRKSSRDIKLFYLIRSVKCCTVRLFLIIKPNRSRIKKRKLTSWIHYKVQQEVWTCKVDFIL